MTDLQRPRRQPLRAAGRPSDEPDAVQGPDEAPTTTSPTVVDDDAGAAPVEAPAGFAVGVADDLAVVCPGCGHRSTLQTVHKDAAAFCAACDQPLFWIERPGEPLAEGAEHDEEVLRRRPGSGGRRRLATVPCRVCAEPNDVRAVYCLRCGAPMAEPPAPVELPPEVGPVLVVEPSTPALPFWMLVLFGLIGVLVVLAMIAVVVT